MELAATRVLPFFAVCLTLICPTSALADSGQSTTGPLDTFGQFFDNATNVVTQVVREVTTIAGQVGNDIYTLVVGGTPQVDTSGNSQGSVPNDFYQLLQAQQDATIAGVTPTGQPLNTIAGCVGGDALCVSSADPNLYLPTSNYTQRRSDLIAATSGDPSAFQRTRGSLLENTAGNVVINLGNAGGVYDATTQTWVPKGVCGSTPSAQTCNVVAQAQQLAVTTVGKTSTTVMDESYANALLAALANWHCQNVTNAPNGCSIPQESLQALQIEESVHQIAVGIGLQNGQWNQYQSIGEGAVNGIESTGDSFNSDLTAQAIEVDGFGADPTLGGNVASLLSQGVPIIGSGRPCIDLNDQIGACDGGHRPAAGFWYVNYDANGNVVGLTFLTITQQMLNQVGCPTQPCQTLPSFGEGSGLPGAAGTVGGRPPIIAPPPTAAPAIDFVWGLPGSEGLLPATVNGPDVASSPWKGLIGQPVGIKSNPISVVAPCCPGPGVEQWLPVGAPTWQLECYLASDCDNGGSFATASGMQFSKVWNFSSYLQPHSIGPSPSGAIDPTTGGVYDERGYLVLETQVYDHEISVNHPDCSTSTDSYGVRHTSCHDHWYFEDAGHVPSTTSHAIMVRQFKSVLTDSR